MKVLHYKSNFLNLSETFIKRLINHQKAVELAAMCFKKRALIPNCPVFEAPQSGFGSWINAVFFHLNGCLPFYTHTIRSFKPDIIHAHFGFEGYRMLKPCKKNCIPLVVSFYGSDVSRLPSEWDWKRRYQKLACHGSAFIAASNVMKSQLIALGFPAHKIEVVRFGLDLDSFKYNNTYSAGNNLMMVGRMVEKKGFLYALEAVRILNKKHIPVRLDLYGDGILRRELEQKADQWNISRLVTFHGHKSENVISKAYQSHGLLLVPSVTAADGDQEGIPNTLLEGMASGVPVIATKHSAIPEVVAHQKTGLLVNERDSAALAKMILLVKNEQINLSLLRKKARDHIEKSYSIERMVHQVDEIYQHVLEVNR